MCGKLSSKPKAHVFNVLPLSNGARIFGEYRTAEGRKSGLATVVTGTRRGGRKRIVFNKERLPVFHHTPVQVVVVPRVTRKRQTRNVMLLNASIDTTHPLSIEIRRPVGTDVELITPKTQSEAGCQTEEKWQNYLRIPSLQPWGVFWLNICKGE